MNSHRLLLVNKTSTRPLADRWKKEQGSELSTRPETVAFSYTLGALCRLAACLSARVAHLGGSERLMVQLGGSERLMVSHDFFEKLMATAVNPDFRPSVHRCLGKNSVEGASCHKGWTNGLLIPSLHCCIQPGQSW